MERKVERMQNKLTDRQIKVAKPLPDRDTYLADGAGLRLRILKQPDPTKPSARLWVLRFKMHGKEETYNLGSYPLTSLKKARDKALEARRLIEEGKHPRRVLEEQHRLDQASSRTLQNLFDDWMRVYIETHRKRPEYVRDMLGEILDKLGKVALSQLNLDHIRPVLDAIVERGARVKANRILSLLKQMFAHGEARGLLAQNPMASLKRQHVGGREDTSKRFLSDEEIRTLIAALPASGLSAQLQATTLILLATGARTQELRLASWSDVNLKKREWRIPKENSKNGLPHLIHLSPFAAKQFKRLDPNTGSAFVLASRRLEDKPISDKTLHKALRDRQTDTPLANRTSNSEALKLPGGEWSPHDLRRTMATHLGEMGIGLHIIEKMLNHKLEGILAVYQRSEWLPERKQAFEQWGHKLQKLTSTKQRQRNV